MQKYLRQIVFGKSVFCPVCRKRKTVYKTQGRYRSFGTFVGASQRVAKRAAAAGIPSEQEAEDRRKLSHHPMHGGFR